MNQLGAHGEYLLIAAGLAAGALGDVVSWGKSAMKNLAASGNVIIFGVACFGYGYLTTGNLASDSQVISRIWNVSWPTLLFAIVSGAVDRACSEH